MIARKIPQAFVSAALTFGAWLAPVGVDAAAVPARVVYVDPRGDDAASGNGPLRDGVDGEGPVATLRRALQIVAELKAERGGAMGQPVTVRLRGGRYEMREPVRIGPELSGSVTAPVTIEAWEGEIPVLSGGRRIREWTVETMEGRAVWVASLPEVSAGRWWFHQLWVDGRRRVRARHPNGGYRAVAAVPETRADQPWTEGQSSFAILPGDFPGWKGGRDAEVVVMNRWVESRLPVVGFDAERGVLRFGKRSVFKLEPGDLCYAENAREWLDVSGEWWLDRSAGRLYYLPMPGEQPERVEVIAPALESLVLIEGAVDGQRPVEHVHFRGVTFAHAEWYFPTGFDRGRERAEVWPPPADQVGGFAQAAIGVRGAVRAEGLRSARFEDCRFVQSGTYGLELGRGCAGNLVSRCEFADLGAGGVRLGETAVRSRAEEVARDNEVSDCHIHDGGQLFHSAIGVWVGQSPGNRLLHNHIHDFYYTGISLGWTWGYGPALATNSLVAFNHVHHIGVRSDGDGPILSDMAGIYTLGLHAGSVIHNNVWHDTAGLRYGGWGIYFDEGTTAIRAESNLVYRTTHGGFHQHYGRDNQVRNNIFVGARDFQIQRTRNEPHVSFTFERNVVAWRSGRLLEGNYDGSTNFLFRSNVYWPGGPAAVRFAKWSFEEWQQRGQDAGSQIADPGFVLAPADDYRLSRGSPAWGLGFQALRLERVGVRRRPASAKD